MGVSSGGGTAPTAAADEEYRVKAAFLVSLGKYVTWPEHPGPTADLVIGVVGKSPIAAQLEALAAARGTGKQPIKVRHFATPADLKPCHMLFLSQRASAKRRKEFIKALSGKPVLLVGESPGFASEGGMIGLLALDQSTRFEINHQACQEAKLQISAKLLSLAKPVPSPQ